MSKILAIASFQFCVSCKRHGHIIFLDGMRSEEVYFKSEAYFLIKEAKKEGKIIDVEEDFLNKQIFSSELIGIFEERVIEIIDKYLSEKEGNNYHYNDDNDCKSFEYEGDQNGLIN